MKDFVAINFSECFKFTREKLYSRLSEEKNLRKVQAKFQFVTGFGYEIRKSIQFTYQKYVIEKNMLIY